MMMNTGERYFESRFKGRLVFWPKRFPIMVNGIKTTYTPDFYCVATKTYYEVVGSRQAMHRNKHKIRAFLSQYPNIKLEIVNPDGSKKWFRVEPFPGEVTIYNYDKSLPDGIRFRMIMMGTPKRQ